jgi:hypothetical protein
MPWAEACAARREDSSRRVNTHAHNRKRRAFNRGTAGTCAPSAPRVRRAQGSRQGTWAALSMEFWYELKMISGVFL